MVIGIDQSARPAATVGTALTMPSRIAASAAAW